MGLDYRSTKESKQQRRTEHADETRNACRSPSYLALHRSLKQFCDQFRSASSENQAAYILFIVDDGLKNWPQNEKLKRMMTDSERIELFTDARTQMKFECEKGKDFAAGMALGEDLAIYKMSLLKNE